MKGGICISEPAKAETPKKIINVPLSGRPTPAVAAAPEPAQPQEEEKDVSAEELEALFKSVEQSLSTYLARHQATPKERRKVANMLEWLDTKVKLWEKEPFTVPAKYESYLSRRTVCWVEFGFNLGAEYGGRHPALIFRRLSGIIWVMPVSSSRPTDEQLEQGIYVEIPKVFGKTWDDSVSRWVNVLTLVPISEMRVDLKAPFGFIHRDVMKDISKRLDERRTF